MKKNETLTAEFTTFDFESNWVVGTCGGYKFEAKLFDNGSVYGINEGRVSKLYISDKQGQTINYDRSWDIKPTKENRAIFKAVMSLLENSPRRFDLVESLN